MQIVFTGHILDVFWGVLKLGILLIVVNNQRETYTFWNTNIIQRPVVHWAFVLWNDNKLIIGGMTLCIQNSRTGSVALCERVVGGRGWSNCGEGSSLRRRRTVVLAAQRRKNEIWCRKS